MIARHTVGHISIDHAPIHPASSIVKSQLVFRWAVTGEGSGEIVTRSKTTAIIDTAFVDILTRDIVIGQLVAAVTSAFERSWNIDAALRTTAVTCLTFVYIFAGAHVSFQLKAWFTFATVSAG